MLNHEQISYLSGPSPKNLGGARAVARPPSGQEGSRQHVPAFNEAKSTCIVLAAEGVCFLRVPKNSIIQNIPLRSVQDPPETCIRKDPVIRTVVVAFSRPQ